MSGQWLAFHEGTILSQVWQYITGVPATQQAETRGYLQPRCSSPVKGTILGLPQPQVSTTKQNYIRIKVFVLTHVSSSSGEDFTVGCAILFLLYRWRKTYKIVYIEYIFLIFGDWFLGPFCRTLLGISAVLEWSQGSRIDICLKGISRMNDGPFSSWR